MNPPLGSHLHDIVIDLAPAGVHVGLDVAFRGTEGLGEKHSPGHLSSKDAVWNLL